MTHEDARTIMRRIANDYDRLAKVAEGNSPIRKEERLNQKLRTDCSLRPGLALSE